MKSVDPISMAKENLCLESLPCKDTKESLSTQELHGISICRSSPSQNSTTSDDENNTSAHILGGEFECHLSDLEHSCHSKLPINVHGSNNDYYEGKYGNQLNVRIDQEYQDALENREVGWLARKQSVRDSAIVTFMIFVGYLLLGVWFYSSAAGDWPIEESLIFIIYTITTVGYGNHTIPQTDTSKIFTTIYLLVGISLITLVVSGVCQYLVLKGIQAQYARDRVHIARTGLINNYGDGSSICGSLGSNGKSALRESIQTYLETAISRRDCMGYFMEDLMGLLARISDFLKHTRLGQFLSVFLPFSVLLFSGAIVVGLLEGWSVVDSVYFAVVSITTVGYGDFHPQKRASVWFCIFWLPFSLLFMSLFLSNVAQVYIRIHIRNIARIERRLRRQLAGKKYGRKVIARINIDQPGPDFDGESKNNNASEQLPPASKQDRDHFSTSMRSYLEEIKSSLTEVKIPPTTHHNSNNGNITPQDLVEQIPKKRPAARRMSSTLLFNQPKPSGSASSSDDEKDEAGDPELGCPKLEKTSSVNMLFLRAFIQERIALIITNEVLLMEGSTTALLSVDNNNRSRLNSLDVKFTKMKDTADRWLIPRRAREAFTQVSFEVLTLVGKRGLERGQLFDLTPDEFNHLLNPVIVSMGASTTLETWLASTEMLLYDMDWEDGVSSVVVKTAL